MLRSHPARSPPDHGDEEGLRRTLVVESPEAIAAGVSRIRDDDADWLSRLCGALQL
jgi:hypothetical protein